MTPKDADIAKLLKRSLPSPQEVEAAGKEVLQGLLSIGTGPRKICLPSVDENILGRTGRQKLLIAAAAAAVFAALVSLVFVTRSSRKTADSLAVIEPAGDPIMDGELVRAGRPEGMTLVLRDGSRAELRSQSLLQMERAQDGILLRLNDGSVIVTAAKQGAGHLYVETKDAVVSVTGTVFVVSTEQSGSRVGVLEGIVSVRQGATAKTLAAGEQASTSPGMRPVPLSEQVFWSRNASAHLALLLQSSSAALEPASGLPTAALQNGLSAGSQNASDERGAFEVVSVKPGDAAPDRSGRGGAMPFGFGCGGSLLQVDAGHFAVSTNVLTLVALAYGKNCPFAAEKGLLTGGPSWVTSQQFTIQATLPDGSPNYTSRQLIEGRAPKLQAMLRTLLADRFKLVLRREMKEQPVYALTIGKEGPKLTPFQEAACDATAPLTPANANPPGQLPPCRRGFNVNRQSHFNVFANGITLDAFADLLSGAFDRPVVNRTGISGVFDIHLDSAMEFTMFCREPPCTDDLLGTPKDNPPLIFDAIQQQLGLRLESTKAPVERLFIDRVERPPEN